MLSRLRTQPARRGLLRAALYSSKTTDEILWGHVPPEESRFDTVTERRHTGAIKYDRYLTGRDTPEAEYRDVMPLWVADMDFEAPPAVLRALSEV